MGSNSTKETKPVTVLTIPNNPNRKREITRSHDLKNPGRFDHISSEANSILKIKPFGGLSLQVNQLLNPNFSITHKLSMGSKLELPGYTISSSYSSGNYLLQGNLNQMGLLQGGFFKKILPRLLLTTNFQIAPKIKDSQENEAQTTVNPNNSLSFLSGALEYFGKNSTSEIELASDPYLKVSYLRNIRPDALIGFQYINSKGRYDPKRKSKHSHSVKVVGKISKPKEALSLILSKSPSFFCTQYVRKITPRIGFASEFVYSLVENQFQEKSLTSVALKYAMRQSSFQTRVSSSGDLTSSLEIKTSKSTAKFSTLINYPKEFYSIGFGLKMGADL
ncbi:import receptor subunit tom40 [Anaeramoeba flamelloides]|uniref:Import receptor subunit tom40 n=1 Tax=Anaeramoeba flamelloides TaxID=1746091 RepID=A0AAV7YWE6_9EUKA|nr:import receptor subunit tom40 [Anaeramoeba flamelloides]KAJ6243299.1 import receptor subunit tom40 [Anaeramoeba flamelloides]